jgi:hypothetical protein
MKHLLPSLAFAALASACAVSQPAASPYDRAEIGQRFAVAAHGVVYDDIEATPDVAGPPLESSVELDGWGLQAAFLGGGPDFLVGFDQREYEDVDATEWWAGLRYALGENKVRPYVLGKIRYGPGLELPGGDSDDYVGWAAGGGVMVWATDQIYFDANLAFEDVFTEIETPGTDLDLDGWVGMVGLGFAF